MILNFPVGLLCLVTLFIIRPDNPSDPLPGHENERDEEGIKDVSSIRRSIRILSELLRNRNVLVLLATVPVAKLVNPITELMLQYIPRKFDLSLASVSFPNSTFHNSLPSRSNSHLGKSSLVNTGNGKLDLAYSHLTNHQGSCTDQISCHIYKS
jgi:hypothetical protein